MTVRCCPVAVCVRVIFTPGKAAFVWSNARPTSVAVAVCAKSEIGRAKIKRIERAIASRTNDFVFIDFLRRNFQVFSD